MPQTEKQLTAMSTLRYKLVERKNATLELIKVLGNKGMPTQIEDGLFAAYSDIIQDIDTELLATERQQLESAVKYGQDNKTVFAPCNYMEITFKTQ